MTLCPPSHVSAGASGSRRAPAYLHGDPVFLRKDAPKVDADAVFEAMENANDRRILAVTQQQARTSQEIIDATGIAQSTAYRRIQRLEELGLLSVESGTIRSGHPIERYRASIEMAALRLEDGQVHTEWRLRERPEERLHRLWSEMASQRGDA